MSLTNRHDRQPQEELIAGKYRLLELLGRGGMATVHRAVNVDTGEHVAVKLMAATFHDGSEELGRELVARFERETLLARSVDTKHIVRVHDAGLDEATRAPYMVMELLSGEDLSSVLRRAGPLRPALALRIAAQVCVGLAKAHEAGVIHRDIKPSNLFLTQDGSGQIVVKLLDFGIAKSAEGERLDAADPKTLTQTGAMLGSPHYMSPEQAMGAKTVDFRTDIWSLGIVLFKCLSGRTPHDEHDTVGQIIVSLVSDAVPSVQSFAPWVPANVAAVVRRALGTQPADRYEDAGAMLDAIARLLPDGWDLRADMFAPMSDEERHSVKPRGSLLPDAVGGRRALLDAAGRLENYVDAPTQLSSFSDKPGDPSPHSTARGLAVAAAVLAIGGMVSWKAFTFPAQPAAPPTTGALSVAPSDEPRALDAAAAEAPAPPRARSVALAITPATATVTIDGRNRDVDRDGTVAITGDLGSVHEVHVALGARETATEIVITEHGPRPERVSLSAPPTPQARPLAPAQRHSPPPPVAAPIPDPASSSSHASQNQPEFDQKFE